MAESGRRKTRETETAKRTKPENASKAKTSKPAAPDQAAKPMTATKGASQKDVRQALCRANSLSSKYNTGMESGKRSPRLLRGVGGNEAVTRA